jgi:hypothetical protein
MKNIVYIIINLFILPSLTSAGEIYTYKTKKGVINITNGSVPEKYSTKAKKIGVSQYPILAISTPTVTRNILVYKDKNGKIVITNTTSPEEIGEKAKII